MRRIVSGGREIDGCPVCGALWFDYGEIKELTEGRLSPEEPFPPAAPQDAAPAGAPAASAGTPTLPAAPEKPGALLSRMRREARNLRCPRCGGTLDAENFQATGIPVIHCPDCRGMLVPRAKAQAIVARFRYLRENREKLAALGETLAGMERRRMEGEYGPTVDKTGAIPLPVVVPLADGGPESKTYPVATWCLIAVAAAVYLHARMRGAEVTLPGGVPGLPPGTGFAYVPKLYLVLSPFLYSGFAPLVTGCLFLFVLGDNLEERMGKVPYVLLYLFCGICAGAVQVLWGSPGGPPAMGSAGAAAGILGSYLVFFPNVPVRMYGMGRVVTLPAYIFACVWVVATFLFSFPGHLAALINPAPLSLQGSLAGFGAGVGCAVLWQSCEPP